MASAKPLSEEEVEAFLTNLKQADTDKKVDIIQLFGLKLEEASELPTTTLDALTLSIAPLLRSTSHLLISATLTSFLPFYLPLLPSTQSSTHHLHLSLVHFLPPLLEKLNDPKDRIHKSSAVCVGVLGKKCYDFESATPSASANGGKGKEKESLSGMWERLMKDSLEGKGWRGKVEGMKLLLAMRNEKGSRLPLKPWIPILVGLLEDQDQNVRDQARETTVALLSPVSTPPQARTELKKLLTQRNVRKTIADNIISRVLGGGASAVSTPVSELATAPLEESLTRSGTTTPAPDDIEVVYIAGARDLESEFQRMVPFFEGKETEHNWAAREKSLVRTRGMLRGNAHQQHLTAFLAGIKSILEGLGKTLMSLRTTVAQQACALVQELAEQLKSGFDASVENLLPILGKMAGFTKKIIADKSQRALTAIISNTTIPPRLFIAHIMTGMSEKNIQTRQFCTGHLKTFLDVHANRHKQTIESSQGGLEQLETAVKKALVDVNPAVRDLARAAYWSYAAVWPNQAADILGSLDGVAKKQLEKANPNADGSSSTASTGVLPPAAPVGKFAAAKRVPSAMSAMLAEKRRAAKAAEAAGGEGDILKAPRSVSSPIITRSSPILSDTSPAKISSPGPRKSMPASKHQAPSTPPPSSPSTSSTEPFKVTPRAIKPPTTSRPHDLLSRSRSSSLGRELSASPPSSRGSPSRMSPLRQTSTLPTGLRSPGSSSATSGVTSAQLKTPVLTRRVLPPTSGQAPVDGAQANGIAHATTPGLRPGLDSSGWEHTDTPTRSSSSRPTNIPPIEALDSQAAQAVSAARQLVDYEDNTPTGPTGPITPMRTGSSSLSANGNGGPTYGNGALFRTPVNALARRGWEDSPKVEAMTPKMLDKLKERKHEKSWWLRRQQLLDKTIPMRSPAPRAASSISSDLKALESGSPDVSNLQQLALFSEEHRISLPASEDDGVTYQEIEDERKIWDDDKVFERLFKALVTFLQPGQAMDLLEHGMVVLWELVQKQWVLFEDKEVTLIDTLFRLRACKNAIILEATNALISLLCEVSDPLYLFSVIRAALDRYMALHRDEIEEEMGGLALSTASSPSAGGGSGNVNTGEKARAAGSLFGLTAIGMCLLKMPSEVVEVEAAGLKGIVATALDSPTITTRQAANTLLLAIQCVLQDPQRTLSFFPSLTSGQKDLAIYLMEKNGILSASHGQSAKSSSSGSSRLEMGSPAVNLDRVKGEIVGLMARGNSS